MNRLDRFKQRLQEESNKSLAVKKHQFDRRMARISRRKVARLPITEPVAETADKLELNLDNLFK